VNPVEANVDIRGIRSATKLTLEELAQLYGVTRQTIHDWQNGRPAGKFTAGKAVLVTAALTAATQRGILPLRPMSKHFRAQRVKSMVQTLNQMQPTPVNL
jgi:DNA-binding XRE family transcriptional regulator